MLLLLCGDIEICPGPANTLPEFYNARGLKVGHKIVRDILNDFHLLESFANITQSKIDVICILETHIKGKDYNVNSDLNLLPGFL